MEHNDKLEASIVGSVQLDEELFQELNEEDPQDDAVGIIFAYGGGGGDGAGGGSDPDCW